MKHLRRVYLGLLGSASIGVLFGCVAAPPADPERYLTAYQDGTDPDYENFKKSVRIGALMNEVQAATKVSPSAFTNGTKNTACVSFSFDHQSKSHPSHYMILFRDNRAIAWSRHNSCESIIAENGYQHVVGSDITIRNR